MKAKLRILYVEDNPADADLLVNYFTEEAKEFIVTVVGTGRECKQILGSKKFDLILLDNKLPDINGIDILRELVITMKEVPKILMTGTGDEELVIKALRMGAADYVVKQGDYVERLPFVFINVISNYKENLDKVSRFAVIPKHILYIEKNKMDIDLTINYMQSVASNFTLEVAVTAAEALRILKNNNDIDLILMDLSIDDMDALSFMKELRFRGIKKPVIVVTGHGDENKAVVAVQLGAYDYIVKRDNYLKQLPYAIYNAINKFNIDVYNEKLQKELLELNKSLERKVEERTQKLLAEIGERKKAEKQILKLNRVYSLLSNINQAIVRIHDIQKLFDEVCRIAVEEGKFKMAWIGLVNSANCQVEVRASSGLINDYLKKIDINLNKKNRMQGPVGRAIQTGQHFLSNDIANDANMKPWRDDASRLGYLSIIAFPIICKGTVRGTYTLYSDEINFFDDAEIKLLDEMAKDISFAIEFIEGEEERQKIDAALLESETRFEQVSENAKEWIWEVDKNGLYTYVSPIVKDLLGYEPDEIIGEKYFYDFFEPENKEAIKKAALEAFERNESFKNFINTNIHKDGRKIILSTTGIPMLDKDGNLTGYRGVDVDITESKKAEEELKASEYRYRSLFENMFNGFSYCQMLYEEGEPVDFIILDVNKSFEPLTGLKNVIGKKISEVVPHIQEYDKGLFEIYGRVALTGKPETFEMFVQSLNDWYSISVYSPQKEYFVAVFDVITERKRAEQSLKESEERFRSLYENSTLGLYRTTPDGRILLANPALVKMLGFSSFNEISSINLKEDNFYPTYERKYFIDEIEKNGVVLGLESAWMRRDGTVIYIRESARAFHDANGKTLYYDGTIEDITERKLAEIKLKEMQEKIQKIYDSSPNAIWMIGVDGKVIECNQSTVGMLGYSKKEEMVGKNGFNFVIRSDRKRAVNLMNELLTNETMHGVELEMQRLDGSSFFAEHSASLLYDSLRKIIGVVVISTDITNRKQAEESLRSREAYLSAIIENQQGLMWLKDEEGKFLAVNHAFADSCGKESVDDVVGKTDFDIWPRELAEKYREVDDRVMKSGKLLSVEELIKDKNNSKWFETFKSPVKDINGKIIGTTGYAKDITQRKKMENELRNSEVKFSQLFNLSPDAMNLCTLPEGKYIAVNNMFTKLSGYTFEEVLDKTSIDMDFWVNPEQREVFAKMLSTENGSASIEAKLKMKDGQIVHAFMSGKIIEIYNVPYLLVVTRDITERKHAEEQLRKLSRAVEQSPVSIVITDTDGYIEYVNEKTLTLTGYQQQDVIGKNPRIFSSGETTKEEYAGIWNTILDGKEWRGEFHNKKKSGELYWENALLSPIKNSKNVITHFMAIKEDITDRKQILSELTIAKEKAEQSDKLKSEFLAQMSHEIRTPLNGIVGNVGYLVEVLGESMDPDFQDCFDGINLTSNRIIRTVDLILNVSELQTVGYKPLLVNVSLDQDVLKRLYQEYSLFAKQKGLELIYTCRETEDVVFADEYSLTQIFANLIDNAIKYTKKGKVELILEENKKGNLIVEIKDTGIGISKEFFPKIYEPFIQEDHGYTRNYDGSGLGMSLVKGYCKINNASIEVESEKNVGTTIRIIFNDTAKSEVN